MSTSQALPVLRTPDPLLALQAARRLLALGSPLSRFRVNAETHALTPAEARRVVAAFPDAWISPADPGRPESEAEVRRMITSGDQRVAALLPAEVSMEDRPVGSIEEAFLGVVGSGPASMDWGFFTWPAVPELDLESSTKDSYVQIALNAEDVSRDIPSAQHTVFVHFRWGDTVRGEWLARQAGLRPAGPAQWGW
ncbi:hypothetical protein ACH414_30955 [Streptomyces sp. NPDC020422]|uniref:hypothetical protein n=1 Tax=Streptomyces sp. NPDC020422 TaxID=3365074 RepID=UPI003788B22D